MLWLYKYGNRSKRRACNDHAPKFESFTIIYYPTSSNGLYFRDRPMWEFTSTACEKDDTTLIDQAFSRASQYDDINDLELLNEFCALAIQKNATNVLTHLIKQGASVK